MRKHETEVNAHPFGHGFVLKGKEVVGLERDVDRISERKLHAEVGVDKEKWLFVYHGVCLGFPVAVGAVENKQCRGFATPDA